MGMAAGAWCHRQRGRRCCSRHCCCCVYIGGRHLPCGTPVLMWTRYSATCRGVGCLQRCC